MKALQILILAILVTLSQPLLAQQATRSEGNVTTAPGKATATQTMTSTATVVGVDAATRTVTLKQPNGKILNVEASDQVRNFDQIKVGDTVTAKYTQALTLALKKNGSAVPSRSEKSNLSRAPVGAQPSGTVGREVTVLADVVSVNNKNKTITLRGPQGNLVDLKVQDPAQLNNVKKGDQVQAVYTEALAVMVEPAPASSGK